MEESLERLRDPSHGCVSTKDVYLALVSDHVLEFISHTCTPFDMEGIGFKKYYCPLLEKRGFIQHCIEP